MAKKAIVFNGNNSNTKMRKVTNGIGKAGATLVLALLVLGSSAVTVQAAASNTNSSATTADNSKCFQSQSNCGVKDCGGQSGTPCPTPPKRGKAGSVCGDPAKNAVVVSINIGCKGRGNPILDALFAIIRFLSIGVGMVITASTAFAGIQYILARDDPQKVASAKTRIISNIEALLIFIFAYAILDYVIPGQFLQ